MVTRGNDRRVVLVTGATRGVGRAVVEGLAAQRHTVLLGARDLDRGRQVAAETSGDVQVIGLDVTDEGSITAAAAEVEDLFGRLDGLVNNAGVNVAWDVPPSQTDLRDMRAVFATDIFGVVAVTSAFISLLRKSQSPRIVNVSSFRGSLGSKDAWVGPWSASYGPAKTALNAITVHYARELGKEGFAVTAVSPGHVATDLTGGHAPLTPAEGATTIVRLAGATNPMANGKFLNENGVEVPW